MKVARSSYYCETAAMALEEAIVVERIKEICAEFPRYGYRRVSAQLRHAGHVVNKKRVQRIMREQELTVKPRRRFSRPDKEQDFEAV